MPKNLTPAQLREWYNNFSKTLYQKANIDLTRWEDLGRVKHYFHGPWDDMNPIAPLNTDYRYTFAPRNGNDYINPEPDIADIDAYYEWMQQNLQPIPNPSDEQLRELYQLSSAGELMIFQPGAHHHQMQQVWTNENGQILVSPPMNAYDPGSNIPIPEDMQIAPDPIPVQEPKPEDFGLEPMPTPPEKGINPNPGFFSWLGYLLGMNTDYAKLVYARSYPEKVAFWESSLDPTHPQVSAYYNAKQEREAYLQELDAYRSHHLGVATALDYGYRITQNDPDIDRARNLSMLGQKEALFLKHMHERTPQGKLLKCYEDVTEALNGAAFTKTLIKGLMGPKVEIPGAWVKKGVVDPEDYHPEAYELPTDPNLKGAEAKAYQQKWAELAAIASFAALAHPEVAGMQLLNGMTQEESAMNNYIHHISCDIFTDGRPGGLHKFIPNMEAARKLGAEATMAYSKDDPSLMGNLLGHAIRRSLAVNAQLTNFEKRMNANNFSITTMLMETLEQNPQLMAHTGLTKEELQQAKADVAFDKQLRQGLEAKAKLQQYALYQTELTPQQLREAVRDVLFFNVLANGCRDEHKAWEQNMLTSEEYLSLAQQSAELANQDLESEAVEEATKNNAPDLEEKKKALADKKTAFDRVNERLNQMHIKATGSDFRRMLLDENWMEKAKTELLEHSVLDQLEYMDREELGKVIASPEKTTKTFGVLNVVAPQAKHPDSMAHEHEMIDTKATVNKMTV